MENLFLEIGLILIIATFMAVLMRILKQPLIMGHILTGVIVGPKVFNILQSVETVEAFSKFGISILLFVVGLGLSPKVVRDVGKPALITGLGQIVFTITLGLLMATFLGYSLVHALYIAIAVSFSSTIIILKLLTDRGDLEKLYGRISIGFLLVQDLVATIILLAVSTFAGTGNAVSVLLFVLLKGIILIGLLSIFSSKVLPKMNDFFASSGELLFLFSIGWGIGLSILFYYIGFSIEVGALLAGVTLSLTPYSQEIASKLKPLRDFFLIMFFVSLGAKLVISDSEKLFLHGAIFSALVLIGNPLIVISLMGLSGYKRRTGFMAGLTVAQISEFSLILVLLGIRVGHVPESILSLITLVALVTIAGSTYMIIGADGLYVKLKKYVGFFERKSPKEEFDIISKYDVILFGCRRVGYDFIEAFKGLGQGFLCIDYDPRLVRELTEAGINCRYGDVEDVDFLQELNLHDAKMVVCTIPDFEANMLVLEQVKKNPDVIVVMVSYSIEDSLKLYELGADYIIMPHFIGSSVIAEMAKEIGFDIKHFGREKEKHVKYLKERKKLGHKHPSMHPNFEV